MLKTKECIGVYQKIYDENRQIYGATKITVILKQQGYHTCEKTVYVTFS